MVTTEMHVLAIWDELRSEDNDIINHDTTPWLDKTNDVYSTSRAS